jgi:hypothetical protein
MKDRNLSSIGEACGAAAGVADVLLSDEHVDVLPDLSLLGRHAVTKPRAERPQRLQCVAERGRRPANLDPLTSIRKGTQRRREMKADGHLETPGLRLPAIGGQSPRVSRQR